MTGAMGISLMMPSKSRKTMTMPLRMLPVQSLDCVGGTGASQKRRE